jgi:hypothetical protein
MHNKALYFILVLIISCILPAEGQKLVNSPYSRFNLGKLEQQGSFKSSGMGGIGIALRDNNSIQFSNPASYSSFDTLSFIFDFGIDYSRNVISSGNAQYFSDDMNFHHFIIGFPLSRNWGFAAGIVPYSSGYYSLYEQTTVDSSDYDPMTGEVYGTHKGTGGYNTVFLGTGLNITKNISAGVNLTVLFGQIERINQITMQADNYLFNSKYNEILSLRGMNFDYGIQYSGNLKNDHFINAGISYTLGKNYGSDYEKLNIRFLNYYLPPYSPDTVSFESTKDRKVFLPQTLRIGIAFGKKDLFLAGIDYIITNWSKSTIPGSAGYITDSKSLRFGMEYTPEKYASSGYLKAMDYRIGGHYSDSYLVFNGSQLKEFGFTLGFGLPMLATISKTNLYLDYTKKHGSKNSGLPGENVFSVGLSLNMYDYWFLKRKYN